MRLYGTYVICLVLLKLIRLMLCKPCNTAEYKINEECCPMCAPGHIVLKHCDSDSGTQCKVCTGSTYTDEPNGLTACLTCTVCDEGAGLRVKRKCKYDSDTLCEPLPGHYCTESHGESCRKAQEHSACLPGQNINQTGTTWIDTVCKDCPQETYSDGSFMDCKPHTNCESLGQITITQGTKSSDAVCTHKPFHFVLVIGVVLLLLLVIFIFSVLAWKKKLCCTNIFQSSGDYTVPQMVVN
ncbi:tumor necrosis factor receptor superfamily member 14-like isoform 1-T2 [Clarias gariepinus]|uniref:tumor necrosis factor receptor superfamily member 14-like isoform X2 n=1 Tax=Clarias gariepinus TaxID=13013 RepID=UPI00234CBFDA|nr:tumor necrosis factor receptor superfamily member 14-like isoform X2 [Clarias gariepinus]XP_053360496.1 tumor necrosis factor receptor superfamily member 14-like isoform X2 [Clarias gariepinus]